MCDKMYNLKTIPNKNNFSNFKINQEFNDLSKDFILINPREIKEFTKDKSDLVELINASYTLISNFFPDSKIYLEYKEDPECDDLNAIFGYIIVNTDSQSNKQLYNDLLKEFVKLKKLFSDAYFSYYIKIKYNEGLLINKIDLNHKNSL